MWYRICFVVVFLAFGGCTMGSGPSAREPGDTPVLLIATDATFPPFHFVEDSGAVTGFDVELARRIAEQAGYSPEVIVVPYDQLFAGLLASEYDVVAATTGITAERKERYLFSDAYFHTCQAALVRTGAGEPLSLDDLKGRRVGAAGSGTSVAALQHLPASIPVLLSEKEATQETILDDGRVPALERNEIDALVVDELDAVDAAKQSNGRYRVLPNPVALEQYGFVFSPSGERLKQAVDNALTALAEDGTLVQLQREFGLDRGEGWPVKLPLQ